MEVISKQIKFRVYYKCPKYDGKWHLLAECYSREEAKGFISNPMPDWSETHIDEGEYRKSQWVSKNGFEK